MKSKIEKHTVYGVLFACTILLILFSERSAQFFESTINLPLGIFAGLMPYYAPVAMIGFPIMIGIYKMKESENNVLQKRLDGHIARWEVLSKKEEDNSSLVHNSR